MNTEKKIEDLEGEIWKPVIGFEGLYAVSNRARVKSLLDRWRNGKTTPNERLMRLNKVGKGYYGLLLYGLDHGFPTRFTIHRLVGIHFIPNPQNLPEINHKKGNKSLNWDTDLEWGTSQYNIDHAFDTGLNKKVQKNDTRRSKPVIQCDSAGKELNLFPSLIEVERSTGFKYPNIHHAIKNKTQSHGYYWKYKN